MKRILFAIMAIVCLALTSCETSTFKSKNLVGTWEATNYRGTLEYNDGREPKEWDHPANLEDGDGGRMDIKSNGTVDIYMYEGSWIKAGSGEWTLDGDILTIDSYVEGEHEIVKQTIIKLEDNEMELKSVDIEEEGIYTEIITLKRIK